ncbi:MAG: hypothetical protein IJE68_03375 [Clostridia bacterium]|nr:hypothetical protein [Clostridia bacterium]
MLDSNDAADEVRQEKLTLLKYTYEQILATQAEQVNGKSNNIEDLKVLGKKIIKDGKILDIMPKDYNTIFFNLQKKQRSRGDRPKNTNMYIYKNFIFIIFKFIYKKKTFCAKFNL